MDRDIVEITWFSYLDLALSRESTNASKLERKIGKICKIIKDTENLINKKILNLELEENAINNLPYYYAYLATLHKRLGHIKSAAIAFAKSFEIYCMGDNKDINLVFEYIDFLISENDFCKITFVLENIDLPLFFNEGIEDAKRFYQKIDGHFVVNDSTSNLINKINKVFNEPHNGTELGNYILFLLEEKLWVVCIPYINDLSAEAIKSIPEEQRAKIIAIVNDSTDFSDEKSPFQEFHATIDAM